MVSFTPPICSGGWERKRLRKCAASSGGEAICWPEARSVSASSRSRSVEEQVIGVLQRHVGADLAQRFQRGGDVGLRLVLEEAFVAGLAEGGGGIDDGFREGVVGDAAVGGEIVGVPRLPAARRAFGPDLEQDEVVLAAEVLRHRARAFPNRALCRRCRGRPTSARFGRPGRAAA